MCFTLGIFTNSVTQVLIQWFPSSLVDAHVRCVTDTNDSWFGTVELTQKGSIWKYVTNWIWESKYHSFSWLQKPTWQVGGVGKRPLYTVSKVFVCLYITGQIFLWIPYSECFVIHNEGSCRNGGGGTDNPSGILLCSKGHLVESCLGMHT